MLAAERQDSDPADKASRFSGMHERLGAILDLHKVEVVADLNGREAICVVED